ncbi:MAG: DUF4339 domain-containing protein [Chthoniobacterales bacterium]|nr:DUF4339 domain-containing protein [Chthoniobacterales bacterium]
MNPVENNGAAEWFVRVQGKEYGPVDLDELLAWKAEGRLIAENEVRAAEELAWTKAAEVPELFPPPPPLPTEAEQLARRRTLAEIIRNAAAIYRIGFPIFFGLALLVAVPSFILQVGLAHVRMTPETGFSGTSSTTALLVLVMIPVVLATWFVFIAGVQYTTADILAGRVPQFADLLGRVKQIWSRVARVGCVVYGSYLLWTLLPLLAMSIVAGGQASAASLLLATAALGFLAFMVGRLFVNFMFWQQACTIGERDVVESLQESRELGWSGVERPRLERPLFRGAILAALWVLVLLLANTAIEMPFLALRLQGVASMEQVQAVTEQMRTATAPDGLTLLSNGLSSLLHAFLRPLLGIMFVLLYFDARARMR